MNSLWITIIILLVFGGFLILYFLLRKKKEKGFLHRGMNLALFLVTIPQQKIEKEKEISLEEY